MLLIRRKRICILAALVLIAVLLGTGCSSGSSQPEKNGAGYRIYCTDKTMTEIKWEYYDTHETDISALADELLDKMAQPPTNDLFRTAFSENVSVIGTVLYSDSIIVDYSRGYSNLDRAAEVMLRASTVMTLCQIDGINSVEIYVEGNPLKLKADQVIGPMSASDFIDNLGQAVNFTQTLDISVFFADGSAEGLKECRYSIENKGYSSAEQIAMEQLLRGPLKDQSEVRRTIDDDTELQSVTVRDSVAYVSFSKDFLNPVKGVSADMAVYSVVNTLTSLPRVSKVVILVDGDAVKNLDNVDLSKSLDFKADILIQ